MNGRLRWNSGLKRENSVSASLRRNDHEDALRRFDALAERKVTASRVCKSTRDASYRGTNIARD